MLVSRHFLLKIAYLLCFGTVACNNESDVAAQKATQELAKQSEKRAELLARRDALLRSRAALTSRQKELETTRQQKVEQGQSTAEIDLQIAQTQSETEKQLNEEQSINTELSTTFSKFDELSRKILSDGKVATREASLAVREKDLAGREAALAARETGLAKREIELASKWKDSCTIAPATTTIIQSALPSGGKYRKKDVESQLEKARSEMRKRAILWSDLPASARSLEKEANHAVEKGDFAEARLSANQLLLTITSIEIGRGFVSEKINRLGQKAKESPLSGKKKQEMEHLMLDVTQDYGDGNYGKAHRTLSKIFGLWD